MDIISRVVNILLNGGGGGGGGTQNRPDPIPYNVTNYDVWIVIQVYLMDWVAGLYAIYGLDDVILNIEGRMQMRYNIKK